MTGLVPNQFAALWNTPGVSEFISAIVGALIGSISGGIISWKLQQGAFKREREIRQQDKKATDRALLLHSLYEALRAASDIQKLAEDVRKAKQKSQNLPPVRGLSNSWLALQAQANLPEPVSIPPDAVTVFIDHKEAKLAMGVLDIQAIHHGFLKAWENYGQTYRNFGREVPMVADQNGSVTIKMTQADFERLYPQLKELSDIASWLYETAEDYATTSKNLVLEMAPFIEKATGTKVEVVFEHL